MVLLLLLDTRESVAEESSILLVANRDVAPLSLNRDTVRAIFAMRQRTWPNGQTVRVFVLPNDHPVHRRFAKERLAIYPRQLQLSWDRMVFSGIGQAPNRADTQPELLERIATTSGGFGYLNKEYLDERVQVIPME
ncbi:MULTISPECIES: hypothetical protein [unclassified Halomonas]|uniref:hypothetical protein n=1 Tax=unclassified Halomonas TaxID=2609666 RepID=UPI0020B880F0|nr:MULTISPECIES: hypothetical protein [Halomonas]